RIVPKYQLPLAKLLAITNGINLNVPFPNRIDGKTDLPGRLTLFYCGPVDPVRLEGLVPCFQDLFKKIDELRLIVVGPQIGNGYQWLKDQMDLFHGKVGLDIKGLQPYGSVLKLIAASDICICPYPDKLDLASAYPVKIFDYMAMGKPSVVSGLPGTMAITKHNEDALVFEPGDYQMMAQYILDLHNSEELKNRLSANARKNVKSFSWDRINQQIFQFLEI
ncbi:MAG: glycosyltransferase family 4 protein, partial [Desulfobacteraceae bacterium]|nr:glycosyltransferase family 4 protein [Desulfobacteraceae bacterium]